jgi:hypothetical protein
MKLDLYDYYNQMRNNHIVLSYKGDAYGDYFNCILSLVEKKLVSIEINQKIRKRIFKIFVEVLQNIYHYFRELDTEVQEYYSIIVLLCKEDSGYTIITGNHVQSEKVAELRFKIDEINALSETELKNLYINRLNDGSMTKSGGAGLGILDIVRRSGGKLQYDFREINEKFHFFSLNVKVAG